MFKSVSVDNPTAPMEKQKTKELQQKQERAKRVNEKFHGLKEVQWRFNERIFQIISKTYTLAKKRPQLLVCALRVIMNEETAYTELPQQKNNLRVGSLDSLVDQSVEDSLGEEDISIPIKKSPFSDHEYLILRQPGSQGNANHENSSATERTKGES